jgi:hypothetical protein
MLCLKPAPRVLHRGAAKHHGKSERQLHKSHQLLLLMSLPSFLTSLPEQ